MESRVRPENDEWKVESALTFSIGGCQQANPLPPVFFVILDLIRNTKP